jgi:hypothetical protein
MPFLYQVLSKLRSEIQVTWRKIAITLKVDPIYAVFFIIPYVGTGSVPEGSRKW